MKIHILLMAIFLLTLNSCKDIIDTEPNFSKKLLYVKMSQDDSLAQLKYPIMDIGDVKIMSTATKFISLKNSSEANSITIYSLKGTNSSGLFTYSFPEGFPFTLAPLENTEITKKVELKFIADVFKTGKYYDTLIVNQNKKFTIPVEVNVIF